METEVGLRDGEVRPATLTWATSREPRGGVVLLHGAQYGSRNHPLYERTAAVLAAAGLHVMAFDRRVADDVLTLDQQATDAHDVRAALREQAGLDEHPVGWWGWSQGAWAATLAAAADPGTFVLLVGYSAHSPAEQMRLYTRNLLIENGHGEVAVRELAKVRGTYDAYLDGRVTEQQASGVIETYRGRPWFEHAWIPEPPLPDPGVRRWMVRFQPRDALAQLMCPVTAVWGRDDIVVDVEAGRRAVEELGASAHAHVIDQADHGASPGDDEEPVAAYANLIGHEVPWLLDSQG